MLEENVIIAFLKKFNQYPFGVKMGGNEYLIGEGKPEFTVLLHKSIPISALMTSTSLGMRFVRMWELYLSACAATFHNGIIDLHQVLFTNGINNELPIVRWY